MSSIKHFLPENYLLLKEEFISLINHNAVSCQIHSVVESLNPCLKRLCGPSVLCWTAVISFMLADSISKLTLAALC